MHTHLHRKQNILLIYFFETVALTSFVYVTDDACKHRRIMLWIIKYIDNIDTSV